jgi:mRNA-degrading endonuclease YafQ of YafQ-DinJ toxin-antitoxin module
MEVVYTPAFVRMLKALPGRLQEEAIERISDFKDPANHTKLKVHKLKGCLQGRYSFSVNYSVRIVFSYTNTTPREARLDAIGDHDVCEL